MAGGCMMTRWYVYYEGDPAQSVFARFIDIVRYSLQPYDGRILVRGAVVDVLHGARGEGGYKILVEFPDRAAAEQWYQSALVGLILEKASVWPDGRLLLMEGAA